MGKHLNKHTPMEKFNMHFFLMSIALFLSPDRYDKIPSYIETKLLPFQRDGVRYVSKLC